MIRQTHALIVFAIGVFLMADKAIAQSASTDDGSLPVATADETTEPSASDTADAEGAQASPIRVIADPELARAAAVDEEDADEELICRRTQVTGTHRRVRRCFTRAELDAQREDAQEFLRDRVIRPAADGDSQ